MREDTLTEVQRLSRTGEADEALDMDEEAFRLFYQRTSRALWAYLSRMSGDRQLADDLLQETYYRLLRRGRSFDSDEHRRHYLFRIATNLVLDVRRRPRLQFRPMPGECDAAAPRTGDSGEQAVRRADLSRAHGPDEAARPGDAVARLRAGLVARRDRHGDRAESRQHQADAVPRPAAAGGAHERWIMIEQECARERELVEAMTRGQLAAE